MLAVLRFTAKRRALTFLLICPTFTDCTVHRAAAERSESRLTSQRHLHRRWSMFQQLALTLTASVHHSAGVIDHTPAACRSRRDRPNAVATAALPSSAAAAAAALNQNFQQQEGGEGKRMMWGGGRRLAHGCRALAKAVRSSLSALILPPSTLLARRRRRRRQSTASSSKSSSPSTLCRHVAAECFDTFMNWHWATVAVASVVLWSVFNVHHGFEFGCQTKGAELQEMKTWE